MTLSGNTLENCFPLFLCVEVLVFPRNQGVSSSFVKERLWKKKKMNLLPGLKLYSRSTRNLLDRKASSVFGQCLLPYPQDNPSLDLEAIRVSLASCVNCSGKTRAKTAHTRQSHKTRAITSSPITNCIRPREYLAQSTLFRNQRKRQGTKHSK